MSSGQTCHVPEVSAHHVPVEGALQAVGDHAYQVGASRVSQQVAHQDLEGFGCAPPVGRHNILKNNCLDTKMVL